MTNHMMRWPALLGCATVLLAAPFHAAADEPDLAGSWYGLGHAQQVNIGDRLAVFIFETAPGQYAGSLSIPVLGLADVPVMVTLDQQTVTIGIPSVFSLVGVLDGETIQGSSLLPIPIPPYSSWVDWQVWKDTGQGAAPGSFPAEPCDALPALYCLGDAAHCGELVSFEPVEGPGYIDDPVNGETWDDQYRSYLRRDLRQLVEYATAKVACMTAHWDTWPFSPLGLLDMSEADGAIPGSSVGYPGHPPGTHEDGRDIDLAYYQQFAPDNHARVIGWHHDGFGEEQHHLVAPPFGIDLWRTALLLAYLSEHPRTRAIGVDGQAGLLLEPALDQLVDLGWIEPGLRDSIPLAYELEDTGLGWFLFHHHHLHLSMNPAYDIVASAEITPRTLNRASRGRFVTAHLEFDQGIDPELVDATTLALIVDGHTLLYARPESARVSDGNRNGIPDLTVKFDRQELLASLGNGEVEVSITGSVGGFFFQDCATIRITGRTPPGQLRVKRRHATPIIPFARPGGRHIWHQ